MFVWTVGYVDMTTERYYIIERIYFIYRLFILFIRTFSFLLFLYTVTWRYERDYLHSSIDITFYIINTMKKHNTLLYHVRTYNTKKVQIWICPPSPLILATSVIYIYDVYIYIYIYIYTCHQLADSSCFALWEIISTAKIKWRSWRTRVLKLVGAAYKYK